MSWWSHILGRAAPRFLRRKQDDRDLEEEIRFYLAKETQLRIDRGEPPESAKDSVRRDFGNVTLVKEVTREMWGWHSIETFLQDLGYAVRQLRHNRSFTVVAVVTLALGIGVNTAIFSLVNSFLFRPLPVKDPDQITVLTFRQKQGPLLGQFSYLDFDDIRRQSTEVFTDAAGYQIGLVGLNVDGKSARMWVNYVTGNYFTMLGVQPALGRLILPSEGTRSGADPVLVLGHSYWKRRFGADPSIVGKRVSVNGQPVTIVGVAPANFRGLSSVIETQGYLPLRMASIEFSAGDFLNDRSQRNLQVFPRLKPGVRVKRAQVELSVIAGRLSQQYPKLEEGLDLRLFPERLSRPEPTNSNAIAMIGMLFLALAGLVLLLACINVANILLVRATVRQREMAVRAALGAGRIRLARQLLTESLLLGLLGGAGGVLLGVWSSSALGAIEFHTAIPVLLDFHFDWNVFSFALAAALLTGGIVGIVPAVRCSRGDLAHALRSAGRSVAGGGHRFRSALVAVQVAGSLMLLIVAALFTWSLKNAQHANLGFDPNRLVNMTIDPSEAGYNEKQRREFYQILLDRVRAMPGVDSASLAFSVPMGYYRTFDILEIPGYQAPPGEPAPVVAFNMVSSDYFETMRIPIRQGRAIAASDTKDSRPVAVINEAMAARFWPNQNPIGRRFLAREDSQHPLEVVGVAGNSRTVNFSGPMPPYFYLSINQQYISIQTLQVRTSRPPQTAIAELQKLVETTAPGIPLFDGQTMVDGLGTIVGFMRFQLGATIATALGVLGLVLAVVGLYGVVSYAAAQRTQEIGIRMALGAESGEILAMIVRQGLTVVAGGLVLGLIAAAAAARFVGSFLVEVSPTDPLIFAAVTLLLAIVALAACYIPARRATRIDPMAALRTE